MSKEAELLSELRVAAAMCGPECSDPPSVRAPFPLIALPAVLQRFVQEAASAMDVAMESVATPAMAACAAAIGNTVRIRLTPSWVEPPVLWAVTLMESGSLKTPAYNAAVEPLREAQREAEQSHKQKEADYKKAQADYEADRTFFSRQPADERTGSAVSEPVQPSPIDYITSDSTVEAVALLLSSNPRGLALTRDELSGFFSSFGQYKGGRGGDESTYLEFYNAGMVKLNRASGKRIFVDSAALTIFGTCQPAVFLNAIGADGRAHNQVDNGLAARFLIAAPPAKAKQWREPKPYESRHYHRMITGLLAIPLLDDENGVPEPAVIDLTPSATDLFGLFVNEHGKYTSEIANPALRYHYAKLEAVAARLALIFYLCDAASEQLVDGRGVQDRHILAGIAMARWFGREAMRVYDSETSDADLEKSQLLTAVKEAGGQISVNEMRKFRKRWLNPVAAEMAMRALARAGFGEIIKGTPTPRGGRPATIFRLHDDAPPMEPSDASGNGN